MIARHFDHPLALVGIVCILSLFLFPAAGGTYSAVHGPITALQAMRAAMKLRWSMMMAALGISQPGVFPADAAKRISKYFEIPWLGSRGQAGILRC